jgi:hypothetical protein
MGCHAKVQAINIVRFLTINANGLVSGEGVKIGVQMLNLAQIFIRILMFKFCRNAHFYQTLISGNFYCPFKFTVLSI